MTFSKQKFLGFCQSSDLVTAKPVNTLKTPILGLVQVEPFTEMYFHTKFDDNKTLGAS